MNLPVMPPVAPMLAKPAGAIPPGQFYEPKWDGFRSIVFRDGDEVEIGSRKERPMTRYFPEVVAAVLRSFPPRAVIDGEIVIAGDGGLDFSALQQRIHPAASRVDMLAAKTPASFVAFDLLALGDDDLTSLPFAERRALLERALEDAAPPVHLTPITRDEDVARDWFEHFEGLAPVGVIGAFPMARRRELFAELQPLVIDFSEHPWSWAAERGRAPEGGSRWNPKKDLSFTPLRPVRVVEVRYDYLEGARFRHPPQFVRWRPEREASSCGFAQLDQPTAFDIADVLAGRLA